MRKSNKQSFVNKAVSIHGDKYNYDSFVYINNKTKGEIVCPMHGSFWMIPNSHLSGQGCPECAKLFTNGRKRSLVFGVGINDIERGESLCPAARVWYGMLMRCYSNKYISKYPTYRQCEVAPEWLALSKFKRWFEKPENGYHEGYHLDKDILVKGNKIYSPDTCCFVPNEINSLIVKPSLKSNHPRGVFPINGKYKVIFNKNNRMVYVGVYETEDEAFIAYKTEKQNHIKNVAQKYYNDGLITAKVFTALLNYNIEKYD